MTTLARTLVGLIVSLSPTAAFAQLDDIFHGSAAMGSAAMSSGQNLMPYGSYSTKGYPQPAPVLQPNANPAASPYIYNVPPSPPPSYNGTVHLNPNLSNTTHLTPPPPPAVYHAPPPLPRFVHPQTTFGRTR